MNAAFDPSSAPWTPISDDLRLSVKTWKIPRVYSFSGVRHALHVLHSGTERVARVDDIKQSVNVRVFAGIGV